MLHPKQNRIDYGNQLIPPEGYELQRAIGTTYSLDLEALMVLPVALFYSQPLDGDPAALRFDMLDAITKAADKITVYCQKGQIKVPNKFHHLIAYWERGIREIQMPHYSQSFHPKVWIIRYVHPSLAPLYRVLVTSRNLTFARDWDVAFSSDGVVGNEVVKQNNPLIDFIKSLDKEHSPNQDLFFEDLSKVEFDKELGKFTKLFFRPIGITGSDDKIYINLIAKTKWDEILVISPFVDNTTLRSIADNSGSKRYLLSRKEELDDVNLDVLKLFNCFQFSRIIEESELNEDLNDTDLESQIQNLHAKLFITLKDEKVHWFLGSANCTDPAQGRNVEFMVELQGAIGPTIKPRDIFNQLTNPEKNDGIALFEPYDPSKRSIVTDLKELELDVRKIKYNLCLLPLKGEAIPVEGGTAYNLILEVNATELTLPENYLVRMKPISEEQKKGKVIKPGEENIIYDFTGYAETKLSPFVEVEIWYDGTRYSSFLLTMDIQLPISRLNKIFSSIIDSRDKFLKYLSFLLTGEETSIIETITGSSSTKETGNGHGLLDQLPIYEKLLIAASRFPDKLGAVNKLIARLKDENPEENKIITPEFEEFWEVFNTYHKSLENAG